MAPPAHLQHLHARPPPGAQTAVLVVTLTVVIALSLLVVRWDEKRLDEAELERAWPPSSRDAALIGLSFLFSPLAGLFAVFFHFSRTRGWRLRGLALGVVWTLGIFVVTNVVASLVAAAVGFDIE